MSDRRNPHTGRTPFECGPWQRFFAWKLHLTGFDPRVGGGIVWLCRAWRRNAKRPPPPRTNRKRWGPNSFPLRRASCVADPLPDHGDQADDNHADRRHNALPLHRLD